MDDVVTATRFWLGKAPEETDAERGLRKLRQWSERAVTWSKLVLIGVRTELDYGGSMDTIRAWGIPNVIPVEIKPWIGVSAALNALLTVGATYGEEGANSHHFGGSVRNSCKYILFQSVEIETTFDQMQILRNQLEKSENYMLAGAALPGHEFEVGIHDVSGVHCAWNTCAMWRMNTLGKFGFLSISDGIVPGAGPQIEEVACVSVLQALGSITEPDGSRAFLLKIPGVLWTVDFESSPERMNSHKEKMDSKVRRAAEQLSALGIPAGKIEHILP